jgi:MscS family membrane protein
MFEIRPAVFKKNICFVYLCLTVFLLLSHLFASSAISAESEKTVDQAQNQPPAAVVVPLGPEDDYDRGVPRTSVKRFLEAARNGDFESAVQHLDLRNLPRNMRNAEGTELAR